MGPLLFIIYINDLHCRILSDISEFADDTKTGRLIEADNDAVMLDDKLYEWAINE